MPRKKGQIPPPWAGRPTHSASPCGKVSLALPTQGPVMRVGVERRTALVTFLRECFIKIELPILDLKLKRKIARIRSLF